MLTRKLLWQLTVAAMASLLVLTPTQRLIEIDGPPSCIECSLAMTLEVRLSDRPDLERPIVASAGIVVRDTREQIFVVHGLDLATIQVFAADGTFITSIGRKGQGPGEFGSISALALGSGGNLYAFDWVQQRVTTFTPDFEVIETRRFPSSLIVRAAFVDAGEFVIAARSSSPDMIGFPLHALAPDLSVRRSFGAIDETVRGDMRDLQSRSIAISSNRKVWSARRQQYLIEEWDRRTGALLRAFERVPDWFTPWTTRRGLSMETPPQPKLIGIWQDPDGIVWTMSLVAAVGDSWREGLYSPPAWPGELMILDSERYYDTYIEAIEPASGRLLLSERVDQSMAGFTNDGLMIGVRSPEGEVAQLDLWRATIQRTRGH